MNILIGDDHSILRKGMIAILVDAFPNANIEEANDGVEIIKKAVQKKWDIIISDISMPNKSGLEILKEMKTISPKTPILILSVHAPEQYAVRALKAGAAGYLTKESAPEELVKVVTHILAGHKYITPEIAEILVDYHTDEGEQAAHQALSNREFEILKLIASGKTISEIAGILTLSINTISTYRFRILEKMKMKTNAELTRYAVTNNLV
ncbi:MAG: response regulator transcription factor [Bacteroidetes bacterium]|nr:response regulator transcription factor [Bacteroidota bacterium]